MGKETGIPWTDSTFSSWWGCSHVGPACDHCWAEGVDARFGKTHWGHGAPRRLLSEHARNEPYRWQRNADRFFAEHGRRQRVFTLSMGDLFDNEVPDDWRRDHMRVMTDCTKLEWQICTKRVSNIAKMVPAGWRAYRNEIPSGEVDNGYAKLKPGEILFTWPQNIGVLITIVTQAEADRDVPRLLGLKRRFGIPWVGISYEPAQEGIDWSEFLSGARNFNGNGEDITPSLVSNANPTLDWIIFGGKSGPQWNDRPFSLDWAYSTRDQCAAAGTAFFMKQAAAFRPTDDMIPPDLMIRQWPKGH